MLQSFMNARPWTNDSKAGESLCDKKEIFPDAVEKSIRTLRNVFPLVFSYICFLCLMIVISTGGCSGGKNEEVPHKDQEHGEKESVFPPILLVKASRNTPGRTRGVLKDQEYVYVADGGAGLQIFKVTKDDKLSKAVGSFSTPGGDSAYSLAKKGNHIFMACRGDGVYIIDISAPTTPLSIAKMEPPGKSSFLKIEGNLLYVCTTTHLSIFDISDPIFPWLVGQVQVTSPNQHLVVDDNFVYMAAYGGGFRIIDVSNPSAPEIISETKVGFNALAIEKVDDFLFIGAGFGVLLIFDVANPETPEFVHALYLKEETDPDSASYHPLDMIQWNTFLFVADGHMGLKIFDISNPESPFETDSVQMPGKCADLFLDEKMLTVANEDRGIIILDIFETTDIDNDGVMDGADVFPDNPLEWADTDGDGTGDNTDPDDDDDSFPDAEDAFPSDASEWSDTDGDGTGDNSDRYPNDSSEWSDTDIDGIGDNADPDDDNDGISDLDDEFQHDPFNMIKIADSCMLNRYVKMDGNDVVWLCSGNAYHKNLITEETSELSYGIEGFIGVPSVSQSQVAWRVWDYEDTFHIYLWNGHETRIISEYPCGNFTIPMGYPPSYHSLEVSADKGHISWAGWDGEDYEIFLWTGEEILQITDNSIDDYEPQLNNDQIAWTAKAGKEPDVFFWDGDIIRNISDRPDKIDEDAHLMNGKIAWSGRYDDIYKTDIFFWDGETTTAIHVPGPDYEPHIDGSGAFLTWHNRAENDQYDIYVWDGYEVVPLSNSPDLNEVGPFANSGRIIFSKETESGGYDLFMAEYRVDKDEDGVVNGADVFPNDPLECLDTDGDGIGNNADTDDDNDGIWDEDDAFPLDMSQWQRLNDDNTGR